MKKVLLGLVMAIGAMLALTACGGSQSTPTDAVKSFYDAMKSESFDKALDLCCNAKGELLSDKEKEQLKSMMELSKAAGDEKKIDAFEVLEEEVDKDGEKAKVKIEVTTKGGKKDKSTERLKKIDGKWYVETNTK